MCSMAARSACTGGCASSGSRGRTGRCGGGAGGHASPRGQRRDWQGHSGEDSGWQMAAELQPRHCPAPCSCFPLNLGSSCLRRRPQRASRLPAALLLLRWAAPQMWRRRPQRQPTGCRWLPCRAERRCVFAKRYTSLQLCNSEGGPAARSLNTLLCPAHLLWHAQVVAAVQELIDTGRAIGAVVSG